MASSSKDREQKKASSSKDWVPVEVENPGIDLEFIGPKRGTDGSYPVDKVKAESGEKLLRNIMLDSKLDLYTKFRKVANCGGRGICGTCICEIEDGMGLLSEKTDKEKKILKNKPESWRLACQTRVGNKVNHGKVVVQRLPQSKE